MQQIQLKPDQPEDAPTWDALIERSKNGTFLLRRDFMDYHQDRYEDCSVLFYKKGQPVACFPANWVESEQTVYSHQGLTYGGMVMEAGVNGTDVLEMFDLILDYYKQHFGAHKIVYKRIPDIYSRYPAEEDLYWLFRKGAKLTKRGLSSAIDLEDPICFSELRKRHVQKAKKAGLGTFIAATDKEITSYWTLLDECLQGRHNVQPVHSSIEMIHLMRNFPNNIKLYLCYSEDKKLLAGIWCFHCGQVLHTQYLASNEKGRELGAIDLLVHDIISTCPANVRYLDFGISTENGGQYLNEGLLFQKEGFGGRGICYDAYELTL